MKPEVFTFDETLSLLKDAENWFRSHEIDPKGRFKNSALFLQRARDAWVDGKGQEFLDTPGKFEDFVNVFSQVVEFVTIYQAHGECEDAVLKEKLQLVLKGPMRLSDEKPEGAGSIGRNTMFELTLSSMFRKKGIRTELHKSHDLQIHFD